MTINPIKRLNVLVWKLGIFSNLKHERKTKPSKLILRNFINIKEFLPNDFSLKLIYGVERRSKLKKEFLKE